MTKLLFISKLKYYLLGWIVTLVVCMLTIFVSAQTSKPARPLDPEPPTISVRCYASNVSTAQLYDEYNYLVAFGWEDIVIRPQSPTLWKVTARAYYSLESGRPDTLAPAGLNPTSSVVTCG